MLTTARLLLVFAFAIVGCAGSDSSSPPPPEPTTTDHGVVFRSAYEQPQGEIYYINLDGTGLSRLTNDSFFDEHPAVSPDGHTILYTCRIEGDALQQLIDVCSMGITGSGQHRLTTDSAIDAFPHWSPTGSAILFTSERGHGGVGRDLWLMNPDGSDQQQVTHAGVDVYESGRYSPDGQRLVVTYRTGFTTVDLYLMASDGSSPTPFAASTEVEEDRGAWSPDGTQIAYTVSGFQPSYLVVRSVGGSGTVTIDSAGASFYDVAWSHDGAELVAACTGFGSGLCRITPSGRRITPIPNVPLDARSPDWVP